MNDAKKSDLEDARTQAIFGSLVIQNLLEALVVSDTLTNADVVNVLVATRKMALQLGEPAGENAAQMAYTLDQHFRARVKRGE